MARKRPASEVVPCQPLCSVFLILSIHRHMSLWVTGVLQRRDGSRVPVMMAGVLERGQFKGPCSLSKWLACVLCSVNGGVWIFIFPD